VSHGVFISDEYIVYNSNNAVRKTGSELTLNLPSLLKFYLPYVSNENDKNYKKCDYKQFF